MAKALLTIARPKLFRMALITAFAILVMGTVARNESSTPRDLTGVYQLVPSQIKLPGELKGAGTPDEVPLRPEAITVAKSRNLEEDPVNMCQPIGPFRMMARDGNKIEFLASPGNITLLFEDIARGNRREIYLTRQHPDKLDPTWNGDSVGRWEGDTLVVDTIGFNDKTWLNGAGAPHSDVFHLTERLRLVEGGKYLEYQATAEDSKDLIKPYMYKRYYERQKTDIMENDCRESF